MKKTALIVLLLAVLTLFGCSDLNSDKDVTIPAKDSVFSGREDDMTSIPVEVILPGDDSIAQSAQGALRELDVNGLNIIELLSGNYYGFETTYTDGTVEDTYVLLNAETKEETELKKPEQLNTWLYGSDNDLTMQNRYYYEWKSYAGEDASDAPTLLTQLDGKTGEVKVIDEIDQSPASVHLRRLNDTQFLSYGIDRDSESGSEYDVVSSVSVYDLSGSKRKIIAQEYESGVDGENGEGFLLECFTVKDGEIYGFGRRLIKGENKFYLYRYDTNGNLLNVEQLRGLEDIIGSEQLSDFVLAGNYIVMRTLEDSTSTAYICKRAKRSVQLIMKGELEQVGYAVTGDAIYFILSNVNSSTAQLTGMECPLYVIDLSTDEVSRFDITAPSQSPYFSGIHALSSNEALLKFSESGAENQGFKQFIFEVPKGN